MKDAGLKTMAMVIMTHMIAVGIAIIMLSMM
jgi:hypothetical protein